MLKNKNKIEYGNSSISSLKGADRVRKRPSVIFGSDGLEGCQHTFFEILSNSIDEARQGFGDCIKIIKHIDKSITVQDFARGTPVDFNPTEKKYNWELVFCELYAGGKYNNNSGNIYKFSLGLNGLGACATQYSSEYMDVIVFRDGYRYDLHFEEGKNIGGLKKEKCDYESTGTITKWKPDINVFTDINIPIEYYKDTIKRQAVVNAGLKFLLYDEETQTHYEYIYENGIVDYMKEIAEDKNLTEIYYCEAEGDGKDREDKPEYKVKVELAFCFNNDINRLEYYHNSSFLEYGGSPDKAVKNAFLYEINNYLKKTGKYNKGEKKISFVDIQDSMILISNSFSTITSYENQTKKAITNKFIQEFMTEFIKEKLEVYFIENKEDTENIMNQILANKRSREKAEITRKSIRKKLSGSVSVTNRVKKFVNCKSKDISKRELYIVEGDSALGSCKLARDAEFQALLPVRGKILNCLKADYDRIFKSDIIIDLLKVLGCGVEIKTKHNKELNTFDIDNLNWDKIIICTDADVDGFQIRALILTMIYTLVPTLIQQGKVFIAESPLFEINTKKRTYFAYNQQEKQKIVSKIKTSYTLQRSKGLGENDPEMMWQTTMCPETRRLIKVVPEDIESTQEMFLTLLGDNITGRKQFIIDKGHLYLEMLDIS
ncbi:toprim domain-containing protein [Clostridiaceae bacterium M8S5]|nr:toprim domain-containing protein [Clostridiaceae bacterium M8S5]